MCMIIEVISLSLVVNTRVLIEGPKTLFIRQRGSSLFRLLQHMLLNSDCSTCDCNLRGSQFANWIKQLPSRSEMSVKLEVRTIRPSR